MKPIYEYIDAVEPWKITIEDEESIDGWDKNEITDMMKEYAKDILEMIEKKLNEKEPIRYGQIDSIIDELKVLIK